MANQSAIKKYLIDGEYSYLNQENRNGEIFNSFEISYN